MQKQTELNNFDFLRLFAAMLVFVAHGLGFNQQNSYVCGIAYTDCGQIGVAIFFIISGFLVTKSLLSSASIRDYLLKRILRLYPAFVVSLLFCGLVIGYMFNSHDYHAYLTSHEFLLYLSNLKLIKLLMHKEVPNVFPLNPEHGLNNVYWSLAYEALCYLLILPLFFLKNRNFRCALLLSAFILFIFIHYSVIFERYSASEDASLTNTVILKNSLLDGVPLLLALFMLGGMMSLFISSPILSYIQIIFLLGIGLIASGLAIDGIFYGNLIFYLCLSVAIIQFGLRNLPIANKAARFGDFSYGIYIYAWPMQQLVTAFNAGEPMNIFLHMFYSLCLTLFFAICSWHYIEKPFLKLKPARVSPP